ARNLLPRPSPFDAPATMPAMSMNSIDVGTTRSGFTMTASTVRRGSGIGTMPEFGSIVQNGKFSAAMPAFVNALNKVDLPTLGKPTMPQLKPISILDFECVKLSHRACPLAADRQRQRRYCRIERALDTDALIGARLVQHVAGNLVGAAGMTDADTQAMKTIVAEPRDDVAHAIAAAAATLFEARAAGRQV